MKKIFSGLWLSIFTLMMTTSCEKDIDSNPTFQENTSGFVLNMPANAANNVLDLLATDNLTFTTNQPDYGGIPLSVNYDLQISFDDFSSDESAYTVLTSATSTVISVTGKKFNDAIVNMFQEANEGVTYPSGETKDIYVRLHANINNMDRGHSYSNVLKLQVVATYVAPSITLPETLYFCGSSIGNSWTSWKPTTPVYGLEGNYFTVVYLADGAEFKWGTYPEQWLGYADFKSYNDEAGIGLSDNGGNIKAAKGGWYVLMVKAKINGEVIDYTLNTYPAAVYVIGNTTGDWTDSNPAWKCETPADGSGAFISPAFAAGGELRAYVKVGTFDWWRTEFTLFEGKLFWRTMNVTSNWADDVGPEYSVVPAAGQKLYVNFGTPGVDADDLGEIK